MTKPLDIRQWEMMAHAIAWDHPRRFFRNYYALSPHCEEYLLAMDLVDRCLMRIVRPSSDEMGRPLVIFAVTDTGKAEVARIALHEDLAARLPKDWNGGRP